MELCADLRVGGERRSPVRSELWILLRDALMGFLRARAGRFRDAEREDLEDLASAKALELLLRAESGEWNPAGREEGEVAGYVATVARNGLLRWAEHRRRQPRVVAPECGADERAPAGGVGVMPPEAPAEAREFIAALQECVGRLGPRARLVWFFRAFHELSSRDIASHPDVALTPAHVDVVVNRARDSLKVCLESRGHRPSDFPVGAFATLWDELAALGDSLKISTEDEGVL